MRIDKKICEQKREWLCRRGKTGFSKKSIELSLAFFEFGKKERKKRKNPVRHQAVDEARGRGGGRERQRKATKGVSEPEKKEGIGWMR